MGYSVRYSKLAEKYLHAQTAETRRRIVTAIGILPNGDVKKLQGRGGYRLTIGGVRVLFDYIDSSTIDVVAIGNRGDVYK